MTKLFATIGLAALLAGCAKPAAREESERTVNEVKVSRAEGPATITPKPRETIDPKSTEAAVELVRGFVRLINAGRLNDAYMLLGPSAPPRTDFDRQFARYSGLHATLGTAGDQEGAAGSIYVSVPLTISGQIDGKDQDRSAKAILRRVNDVPGSTEAERHWHIERIDWK